MTSATISSNNLYINFDVTPISSYDINPQVTFDFELYFDENIHLGNTCTGKSLSWTKTMNPTPGDLTGVLILLKF